MDDKNKTYYNRLSKLFLTADKSTIKTLLESNQDLQEKIDKLEQNCNTVEDTETLEETIAILNKTNQELIGQNTVLMLN